MRTVHTLLLCGLIAALLLSSCSSEAPADVVFINGSIWTGDLSRPRVEAFAVTDGAITHVGTSDEVQAHVGTSTTVVDLEGGFAMPGIVDLHTHPFITPWWGSMNLKLQTPGDLEAIKRDIRSYAEAHPDKAWVFGGQYDLGVFPDEAPSRLLLDELVPDRPAAILDQSGHSAWLNSKAIEAAGFTSETPTSTTFVVVKDPVTGEPTGTIREQAIQWVERAIPQAAPAEFEPVIENVIDQFLSYGITTQQTAEGNRIHIQALQSLEKEGRLHQRMYVSWDWRTTLNLAFTIEETEQDIIDRKTFASSRIHPDWVKIFADGSPMAHTSLLIEPYVDQDNRGDANMSTEDFAAAFTMFDSLGVGIHIHTIGDGSIQRVIDAFEIMRERNGTTGTRHKIAHAWMITPEDLDRVAALDGVELDFSPPLWFPFTTVKEQMIAHAGLERYERTFPIKTALEKGITVGQGSDWQTAFPTPNPFIAIEAMVTRRDPFSADGDAPALNEAEAVSIEQALRISTINGAVILGAADEIGSIEVGKRADVILLSADPFAIDAAEIDQISVSAAYLDGERVYQR